MRYIAVLLAGLLAGCGSSLPDGVDVTFEGRDAYDFAGMKDAPIRELTGRLVLPAGEGMVRGAAILSHGSGGPGARQRRMAETLADAGYAALVVDHFGPRDIGSTVEDQLRVTAQDMLADVFGARSILAEHPRISGDRIGVIGWSKGAITASLSSVDRLAGFAAPDGSRLAFSIAFYPFCGWDLDDQTLATPTLYLLGAEDDWTPPAPCVRQAKAWQSTGQPIEWELYEGARHGFDSRSPDFQIGRAITVRDTSPGCTLRVDADGNTVTLEGELGLETLDRRREFLEKCGVRGVGFGGQDTARDASRQRVLDFLDATLPPR
ncbi:MAG: prolyl oligopeptidase family serine peptidase [Pseudomonadota bacterium]